MTKNPAPETPDLKDAWRALIALCIGFFMILLDQTIVAVATPDFQRELGADLSQVVWVTSIYLLTFAVPLLVTGRLGDRFGQRRVYMAGMALFTLSSLACGIAPNIETLIIARAVQGFGASLLTPQTMAVINRIFPRNKRGAAMGVWGAVAGLATLAGPLLGGVIVAHIGWQWIFFINVPIGVLSLILVYKWVPHLDTMARKLDFFSVVLSILGVFAIVFSVQEGPNLGWPLWLFGVLAVGIVLIAVFLRLQARATARGTEALLPLEVFHNHNFSMGAFSIAMMGFAVAGTMLPIMLFLQDSAGLGAEKAGLMLAPMALISGGLAPMVGRLSDVKHPRTLSMIGFGMMTGAMVALVIVMRDGVPYLFMLIPIIMMGFGNAFVWSPNSATSMRDVPMHIVGAASGVYNTSRQVGSVVGSAAIGAAMQVGVRHTSYGTAMGLSMILPALALLLGLIAVSRFTERA
ncbi:DHA2 family efflux MFS transporter permease subunit [Corynebacterium aquilae]|uniref:Membrane protein n=1 Tax=Corynebacterium aquilae DSM 44791 TaxID=1431546 RepID=A0A1L7CFG2_9CORY|nr:DHA2 family efflux MFS transporter permease subunit [Corynebacterium aquilae]APT84592.1 membrane protein [Corynebacterium aquilae DSM 44791]